MDEYDDGDLLFDLEDELWRVLRVNAWLVMYWSIKMLPVAFRLKTFQFVWQMCYFFDSTYSKWKGGSRNYAPILVFKKGEPKVVYRRGDFIPSGELPFVTEKVRNPQFKPTIPTCILLQMFSREDDVVLDPFAGFGSIPLVCELFNRKWMGFEIDKQKYDIATGFIRDKRAGRISLDNKPKNQMAMALL